MEEQLKQFYSQLPPELQEKIQILPPEKQQEVLMQLLAKYNNSQQNVDNSQQFADGGQTQSIPVEAERNENITVQDGQEPQVDGGYLEKQSYNPVTGQATYEIPDNGHSETHDNGGVNMQLSEGDVVNSDKTKIPIDFKIYGKSFKGKTFKDASDYLSKQENKVQDDYANRIKEGKIDKVSDGTLQIILAKLGKSRNELNELQEQVLESKKQKEANESLKSSVAEYGKVVLEMNKAEQGFNSSLDRYLNYKVTDRPVLKAADGLTASMDKFSKFADKVTSNKNASLQDIMSAYKQSGLGNVTSFNNSSFKTPVSFDYKPKNVTVPKQEIFSTINSVANKYGVDPALMFTMADIESSFNPNATSKTGAAGLFQFTKGTGKQYGISGEKRYDLKANTDAGARLLADNQKILIKNGIEPTPVYTYLAHQLGAGGAIELYNNITKGTPISATTMSNMGLNFGKKSAEQYLAETTKKVMSRYDGYAIKLEQKDANLSLDAHQIKQQYQLPYQPEEIKSDLYNIGIKGITERLKTNSYKPTTTNTQQQSSNFAYGGKIYAQDGFNFRNVSDFNEKNWNDLNTQSQQILGKTFQTPEEYQGFMMQNYPELIREMFHKGFWSNTNQGESIPTTVPFDDKELQQAFVDKKYNRRGFIPKEQVFDTKEDYEKFIKDRPSVKQGNNIYYFDPSQNTWIMLDTKEINYSVTDRGLGHTTNKPNPHILDRSKANSHVPSEEEEESSTSTTGQNKTSWLDKLKYGIRESLPYLRNLALMNEDTINPILQQKSYQNPYDNFNTDYSIQSALNDSDRSTLTAMADERGNPSVRSARLAQIAANAIAAKAPLYTQKYNQEQQLQNQKVVGQSQYLNQWEDVNRGLKKDFEHEVLQTREVQRQQKNMAIDNMMNNYLRKQEENQAIKLALMETNFDWNKFTQDYEANPEKMKKNFNLQKYLSKNSSGSDNSKIIEGADGESYEVITPKSGKPIIRKIEKKYGGKVVKY